MKPASRLCFPGRKSPEGHRKTTGLIGRECKTREGFSEAVLIAREAWPYSSIEKTFAAFSTQQLFGVHDSRLIFVQEADETGDISDRDTPVPIPNTEVKPVRADGTNAQLGVGRVGRCRSHQPLER